MNEHTGLNQAALRTGTDLFCAQDKKAAISQLLLKACQRIDCPSDTFVALFGVQCVQSEAPNLDLSDRKMDLALALIRSYEQLCVLSDQPSEQQTILRQFDPKLGCALADLLSCEKDIIRLAQALGAKVHEKRIKKTLWNWS